ncbi:hypothetical protein GGX14DRAFT_671377 [Mycena pura]|uniref:Cytochrome P450 n=1 Tax=Mycena pura TaxID=153505 RepID=A0AAD6UXM1_9AGAR|nr:hypothetical protein GGX14DRAFT_671377 [Mycena pura]
MDSLPVTSLIVLASLWPVYTIVLLLLVWPSVVGYRALRRKLNTTALHGPSSYPVDIAACAAKYGPVFEVLAGLLSKTIMLCDPTAIAHFYAHAPAVYRAPDSMRLSTKNLVGRGLAWADGELHAHFRRVLSPMFSNSAVEGYSTIFFSMANKVQHMWSAALESRPHGMIVDFQHWCAPHFLSSIVSHLLLERYIGRTVSLDSVGLGAAVFGHDFGSLSGN